MKRSTGRSVDEERDAAVHGYEIVVVGTSWGGLAALGAIIGALPAGYDLPVAVVQHRHRDSDASLAGALQDHTPLPVCEIEDKQPIEPGKIFVAPANYHMLVEAGSFSLSTEAPVRFSRPSIDVAFMSAADAYGHRTVGVVLTGSNADGAEGLRHIAQSGGMAVIQEPGTSEASTMPRAALAAVPTARVFSLDRLGAFLGALPTARGTTRTP